MILNLCNNKLFLFSNTNLILQYIGNLNKIKVICYILSYYLKLIKLSYHQYFNVKR